MRSTTSWTGAPVEQVDHLLLEPRRGVDIDLAAEARSRRGLLRRAWVSDFQIALTSLSRRGFQFGGTVSPRRPIACFVLATISSTLERRSSTESRSLPRTSSAVERICVRVCDPGLRSQQQRSQGADDCAEADPGRSTSIPSRELSPPFRRYRSRSVAGLGHTRQARRNASGRLPRPQGARVPILRLIPVFRAPLTTARRTG